MTFSAYNWSLIVNGIVSLLIPFAFFFLCFTLLIFSWISVYHFSMRNSENPIEQLQMPLIIINSIVIITVLILIILLSVVVLI